MKTLQKPKPHCSRRSFFAFSTAVAAGFSVGKINNNPSNKKQKQNSTNTASSVVPVPETKTLNIAKITIGEHLAG
ncbi:MAG: hypothetical protein ACQES9_09020 [Myxococcota bacterium]